MRNKTLAVGSYNNRQYIIFLIHNSDYRLGSFFSLFCAIMILVMKEWSKNKPGVVFFFVVWFILSISFIGNFFGTGLWNGWFDGFQKDSSAIVEKNCLLQK